MKFLRVLGLVVLGLIGLILVIVVGVVLVNLRDEALSPAAQARLARTGALPSPSSLAGNDAVLLWAFDAPAGVDAQVIGRSVFEALAAIPPERVAENDWSIHPLYRPEPFEFPAALACLDPNSACIHQALEKPEIVKQWTQDHAAQFERLASIDSASHWGEVPALVAASAPLPPVRPLIGLYSLSLAQAAVEIHERQTAAGLARLEADVRIARRLLGTSGSVVMKAVSTDLLRRAMLAYSEILREERPDAASVAQIAASLERVATDLSPAERSMGGVMDFEAARARDLALQVAHPATSTPGSLLERMATRAAPLFFKPDATTNLEGELFDIQAPLADSTPASFVQAEDAIRAAYVQRAEAIGAVSWKTPYNPLGRIMAGYSPDLIDYVARIHDDAALMRAVRVQAWLMTQPIHFATVETRLAHTPEALWDPYRQQPFGWRAADSGLAVTQHSSRGVSLIKVPLT